MTRRTSPPYDWGRPIPRPFIDALPAVLWLLAWGLFVGLVVYVALQRGAAR